MAILQNNAIDDPVLREDIENRAARDKYTSPDIQNEIDLDLLTLCGRQVLEKRTNKCTNAGIFAIMADECQDCSSKEQLSVCLRCVSKEGGQYVVREDFIGFVKCKSIKGVDIASAIMSQIDECGLDLLKVCDQCYDGASNMSEKFNGAHALIKERVPLAHYVHCKAHCLNLAVVHSSKLQYVRTMMATVQDIAFAFKVLDVSKTLIYVTTLCVAANAAFINKLDERLLYTCPSGGQTLSRVYSLHDNGAEDRQFELSCRDVAADVSVSAAVCFWTPDWVNDFDKLVHYSCPTNHYISGIDSVHDNGHEDRRFKFYCCQNPDIHMEDCEFSGWVNDYDRPVDFTVPAGMVMKGMISQHDSGHEDRQFEFESCRVIRTEGGTVIG